MFDDVVTIINHYYDAKTHEDKFHKTVLTDCMWRQKTTKTVSNNQIQVDDAISLTILYRDGYVEPNQYLKLTDEEQGNYFTLNADNNMDFVVLGKVEEEITDITSIQNLRKNYTWATIIGVSDNTMVDCLKHWKVTAK